MRKPVTVRRMMTDIGSISFRGKGGPTPRDRTCLGLSITDKGSLNIGSLGLIGRGLSLVEEELVLVGRVLDLKSTTGLVLGLTSMSMLLLLLRKRGFGEAVEKMRKKKSLASLTIFLSNQNLMMVFLRWRPRGH